MILHPFPTLTNTYSIQNDKTEYQSAIIVHQLFDLANE